MGNQSSSSSAAAAAFTSHGTSSPTSVASGTKSLMSMPGMKKKKMPVLRLTSSGRGGKKRSVVRNTFLEDSDETESVSMSIASGTRSLGRRSKRSSSKNSSSTNSVDLFPLASMGRKQTRRRGRNLSNNGKIDEDLDSILAFVQHMQKTADGKHKLEKMVLSQMKKPNESPSTHDFLEELDDFSASSSNTRKSSSPKKTRAKSIVRCQTH